MFFQFPGCNVHIGPNYTITTFPDGWFLKAAHTDYCNLGQKQTAEALGYSTVEAMNREHDIMHTLLSYWLQKPRSDVLYAAAREDSYVHEAQEEAAVLALQAFCVAEHIDILKLGEHYELRRTC